MRACVADLAQRAAFHCGAGLVILALGACAGGLRAPLASRAGVCALPMVTCVKVVMPPALTGAGGVRKVALEAGSKEKGAAVLLTGLESRLSAVMVDDRPFYSVVGPRSPERQATFEVDATAWEVTDGEGVQTRTRCKDLKCSKLIQVQAKCKTRTAAVGGVVKVRDRSGAQLGARHETASVTSTQCEGESSVLDAQPVALDKAAQRVLDKLRDALAVATVMHRVRVMEASGIADAARRQRFDEGVTFLKAGRPDRACPIFEQLIEVETGSVAVYYNAAFCAQVAGDWRRAFQLYAKADTQAAKPISELREALDETRPYAAEGKSGAS